MRYENQRQYSEGREFSFDFVISKCKAENKL